MTELFDQTENETQLATIPHLGCFPQSSTEYHANKAIGASGLKTFRRSRREFMLGISKEPTPDMDTGTLAHAALLEPEKLETLFPIYPADVLAKNGAVSTNEAKAWRAEQLAAGRIPVKQDQFDRAAKMVASVRETLDLWLNGEAVCEHAIYWEDEETGLLCKCRPDYLVPKPGIVLTLDLKTTDDPTPAGFSRKVEMLAHWLQPVHYGDGIEEHFGQSPEFMFAAVENDYPFRCVVHELKPQDLHAARSIRRKLMKDLNECFRTGNWADPWEGIVNELDLKPWTFT